MKENRKGDIFMSLVNTPSGNRLHIGIFGKRNSGKSSLLNAITGQEIALVSEVKGTTTDPVSKAMEIHPIGPCLLIDTAGFDDTGDLGNMRIEKTKAVLDKTDVAVVVFSDMQMELETQWIAMLSVKFQYLLLSIKLTVLSRRRKSNVKLSSGFLSLPYWLVQKKKREFHK